MPNIANDTGNTTAPPNYGTHTGGNQIVDLNNQDVTSGGYGAGGVPNYAGPTVTPNDGPRGASVMMSSGNNSDYLVQVSPSNFVYGQLRPDGVLDFAIEAGPGATARGAQLFDGMMNNFGSSVQAIGGNWYAGTNLSRVNELTAQGVPLEQAIGQTWTAGQAARYGYTNARVITFSGSPGRYTSVNVVFEK